MGRRLTKEEFVERSIKVHGNKYDYSLVDYKNNYTKIDIICPIHGKFEQTPANHLVGNGCPLCGRLAAGKSRRLSLKEFIDKAVNKHGSKYGYGLVNYKNAIEKVKIICPIHGIFEQKPDNHLQGYGCPKCASSFPLKTKTFIEKANRVHSDKYDYSLSCYVNTKTVLKIICPVHGIFEQRAGQHLIGSGCKLCGLENTLKSTRLSRDKIIERANKVHNFEYDYSMLEYKNIDTKIKIICKKHGPFLQSPYLHLNGCKCPKCNCSQGEVQILSFLQNKKAFFKTQYRIKDCKNKRPLPFDFAVFEDEEKTKLKYLIEFDGELHYKISRKFKMTQKDLIETQKRDKIKTDYCLKNNIKLIRIPYWEKGNIEKILTKELTNS